MPHLSRRKFLNTATLAGAAATVPLSTHAQTIGSLPKVPSQTGQRIDANDPRYLALRTGNNQRFLSTPDYIRMIHTPQDALLAVQEALDLEKKFTVRSGGHCFEDFVCNSETEVILDMAPMSSVGFDEDLQAFFVEPGGMLIDVYERLYKGWGVTLPAGICYSVGVGGHIVGGGYGLLSRKYGLTVDHLYMVEVVVVDENRQAKLVRATADPKDPNHDLWWAHTGSGGGNFGVITRYWFRTPDAKGDSPQDLLISPPSEVLVNAVAIDWDQLSEENFTRLIENFSHWHAKNSGPESPYTSLSSLFNVSHRATGSMGMFTQVDGDDPDAEALLATYMSALLEGTDIEPRPMVEPIGELPAMPDFLEGVRLPWLQATKLVGSNNPTITNPTSRGGHKSAYMKQGFDRRQIAALYKHMSSEEFTNPNTMLVLFSFGGAVNAMEEHATANAQRSSIYKMCFQTFWPDPQDDEYYMGWLRDIFEDVFAETGGVPVPNEQMDGCYINYPDKDMADPARNRSNVPWYTLYYKDNYPRLQAVKNRYDPNNVFSHSLSIRSAST
ncbi:MAG: FAD-binding oxidoreductase [Pseudoruegeria sp.]